VSSLGLTSCIPRKSLSGWIYSKNLRPVWAWSTREGITEITFCERVREKEYITRWLVIFDVPTESIPHAISLIETAINEPKTKLDFWGVNFIKLVTNKKVYYVPVNWTSEKIYGNDWMSEELRSFLREKGLKNPGTKNLK